MFIMIFDYVWVYMILYAYIIYIYESVWLYMIIYD